MVVAPHGPVPLPPQVPLQRRVLYIGSAVPVETTEGLEAIQKPLRDRYPIDDDEEIQGIDSILTVLPYGLQLQYVGDDDTVIWFPISSLTLCAAVRCIHLVNGATGLNAPKFVSLSSPAADGKHSSRPAIFTAITRRTTGRKVLECHGFVCRTSADAIDFVQSTKYADAQFDKKLSVAPLASAVKTTAIEDGGVFVSPPFQQPVKLQPANEDGATVTPELNGVPPDNGYFYSSGNNLVKRYTISRLVKDITPIRPDTLRSEVSKLDNQHIHGSSSTYHRPRHAPLIQSAPRMVMPYAGRPMYFIGPPPKFVIPSRPARPHVSNDHRRHPRDPHVFQLPIPIYVNTPYSYRYHQQLRNRSMSPDTESSTRLKRINGRESESSDSSTAAPRHSRYKPFIRGHETSSEGAPERQPTPPADYDTRKVGHVSRRDQYERTALDDTNDSDQIALRQFRHPHPLYDRPNWSYYSYPPRTKSLPPFAYAKSRSKSPKKVKKPKAKRKNKQKGSKYDESSESFGYVSEVPHRSRDAAWLSNQYGNEKAFSQSLMREPRWGKFAGVPTAYIMNQPVFDRSRDIEVTID